MEIHKKSFPILSENEKNYFAQLEGVLSSVDEFASLQITYTPSSYLFRLVPSVPGYINNIMESLTAYHSLLGIRLVFSKSIKTSATINFKINLDI